MIRNPQISTARTAAKVSAKFPERSPRLILSGLCLGGLGLLSSGVSLAQSAPTATVPPPVTLDQSAAAPAPAIHAVPDLPQLMPEFSSPEGLAAPIPVAPVPAPRATAPDAAPTVVLTERSTGCRAVLEAGQPVSGPCRAAGSEVAAAGGRSVPGVAPTGVLGVSYPSLGLGTTPSLKNYYNRRLRPPGRLANTNGKLLFPLAIPVAISSAFGWRMHPLTGDSRFHAGTDLAAPMGTPVLAAYAGQVAIADFLGGYGLTVTLDHNKGTQQTLYGHLSELFVKPGEAVKQGDVIGLSGSTGNSTGPHLHFEFRQLTSEGWMALDAGEQLEFALAQLTQSLTLAQTSTPGKTFSTNVGVKGIVNRG
jgi:Peptidase family M23